MSTMRTTLLHVNYTLCAENPVAFGIHNTFAFNCKGRVGGNRETVGEDVLNIIAILITVAVSDSKEEHETLIQFYW